MKIAWICSALDLRYRFGCTPNWWQFMKGLHERGHDIIAIPYIGEAFETPWWRCYRNPCATEGAIFYQLKQRWVKGATSTQRGVSGWGVRFVIEHWVRRKWQAHLARVLEREKDVDAVIIATVPMNHLTGIPTFLRQQFSVPVVYWDGDVPASLPRFGGFASGFRIYDGADLSEYDALICNSEGGALDLKDMGARAVYTIHWGFDPELYAPLTVDQDRDVYFYGFGAEYREDWIRAMLVEPSKQMPDHVFVAGGRNFLSDMGRVHLEGDVPFNVFRRACCRSRINLNITRSPHASVLASSTGRVFELAFMGCCIVSNPHAGIERWLTPGESVIVVHSTDEALETYRHLLKDESTRRCLGEAARRTALERHTHVHRAEEIVACLEKIRQGN
ncbi:MAG TPA: glycosyltransferase [Candidatus Hydrogenedentes bacterium]|nr:glycosyltransferase [Candidatus Hydrogenedentota bacterium]HOL77488.1 glycosyltransferase [Candidatus Hydrogenedentota bacterium]HPO86265.1 glycosyltransferase [Candidatus Hydrogenedentota bacterium]